MVRRIAVSIITSIVLIILLLAAAVAVLYTHVLPAVVQDVKTLEFIKQEAKKSFNVDVDIQNPVLKTHLSPEIGFSISRISASQNGKKLLEVENLDMALSFSRIDSKKITLKKLVFDNVFMDVNGLLKLAQEQPQEQQEFDTGGWRVEISPDSELMLKNLAVLYTFAPDTNIKVSGKNIALVEDVKDSDIKHLHFNVLTDILAGKNLIKLSFVDDNKVYFKGEKLYLENPAFKINNSKVFLNSVIDKNGKYNLSLNSTRFDARDAVKLMILDPNMREMLSYFGNVRGTFNFDIQAENDNINGKINFNTMHLSLIPFADLPVTATQGFVTIDNKQILLKDFVGYYGKNKENKAKMEGVVRDYMKSVDTEIVIKGTATNELARDYISKLAGVKLELTEKTHTRLTINSIYDKVDIKWFFPLKKGKDILLEGHSFSPKDKDRALRADFHLQGNLFAIKSINYYVEENLKRGEKTDPIINISGNMDARDFSIKDLGFVITKPLPSEFLNAFTGGNTFKNGTIAGNLNYVYKNGLPQLDGKLEIDNVRIPSQRLSIKKGLLTTNKDSILLEAQGRFRRSAYHFDGDIVNNLALPVVIRDVNFKLEEIDIERLLTALNKEAAEAAQNQQQSVIDEDDVAPILFEPNLLVIENCHLKLDRGKYKKIDFGNLDAVLTLDKKGNLSVQSNKFDFAKGISTLKVVCDLVKQEYYIRLGAKDVDIDLVATSILDLEKEITGRASALLELNTDDKFKLNGLMKFSVKDGSITKLGLVQYVLNVASIFRNPAAMISPSTVADLVSVPDGTFKSINGELNIKDNVVRNMKIKSSSPHLSSFIAGRMNLETGDTSLRIYTKFSTRDKGMAGVLRNVSLNSLAQRFDTPTSNDADYYAAEIAQLPEIEAKEKDSQIFLTKVEGDVQNNNFISSLKKVR